MEKISGIIPASPRTRSVDVSNSPALRPGTPSFGVPMGTTAAVDRISFSTAAMNAEKALPEKVLPETWKDKDLKMAKIVDNVATQFFATSADEPIVRSSGTQEQTLKTLQKQQLNDAIKTSAEQRARQIFESDVTDAQDEIESMVSVPSTSIEMDSSATQYSSPARPSVSIRA